MAKFNRWEYWVLTKNGTFPLDMLRHDTCWPASSADSAMIDLSLDRDLMADTPIALIGLQEPTAARWASFGWRVSKVRPYKV